MSIELIPTAYVHQNWPAIEPFIDAASEWANGDFTVDQLRSDLGQGRAFLYCAKDGQSVVGAAVVAFQNGRNKRVAFVLSMGGKLIANQENFEQFAALLKRAGLHTSVVLADRRPGACGRASGSARRA